MFMPQERLTAMMLGEETLKITTTGKQALSS
jgi:hypothetical protein